MRNLKQTGAPDGLGDWRIDTVVALAKQFGNAPAGTPVQLMSLASHRKYRYLSFVTPSAAALCLNLAINASASAEAIRPRLQLAPMVTVKGDRGFQMKDECTSDLYYFFEQSIVAVTMSFQALETFANATIGRKATANIQIKRKGKVTLDLSPAQAERELSTEEKFSQALPPILSVSSPRDNTRIWQAFKKLKTARDETVHLKSFNIYTRNQEERESLFFQFLAKDVRDFPNTAIKVIEHFYRSAPPRWLTAAKRLAESDSRYVPGI